MREALNTAWAMQEGLLQQYRGMAVTLMGLMSAGILVAVTYVAERWETLTGLALRLPEVSLRHCADLIIVGMLLALLTLGWQAQRTFRRVTQERAMHVTFFQNLIIAEESGALPDIAQRHGVPYPLPTLSLHRRLSPGFRPMSFETASLQGFDSFRQEVLQVGSANANEQTRHNLARGFLSRILYTVFRVFFVLTALYAALVIGNIFVPVSG